MQRSKISAYEWEEVDEGVWSEEKGTNGSSSSTFLRCFLLLLKTHFYFGGKSLRLRKSR